MLILLLLTLCLLKTTYNLDELVGNDNLDKVVAYYYEVKEADAKKVDATFDKEKNTILANKEGEIACCSSLS